MTAVMAETENKPKRRGNPNWVKGVSGNPTGVRKTWNDRRLRLSRLDQKARTRLARLIDSEDEQMAFQAITLYYAYTLGKPMDGDVLARLDEMFQSKIRALKASLSTVEQQQPALPAPVPEPVPAAGSLPPEPAPDVVPPLTVQVGAPAVSRTSAARCLYRLSSGPCETEPVSGEQWCPEHKAKLFGMLSAK